MATEAQIADALAGRKGPAAVRWRWERRTASFAFRDDISEAVLSSPTLRLNNDRAVRRDLSGIELRKNALPSDFDATQDFIAPIEERLIEGVWEQFPLGLFRLDVGDIAYGTDGDPLLTAQGADLGVLLTETGPAAPYTVDAGTNYTTAAETILDTLGLSHGLPTVTATLPLDVTWAPFPETTWHQILDDLYNGINHRAPWPDVQGKFKTAKQIDPSTEQPAVTASDGAEPRMIDDGDDYERRDRPGREPNHCVVLIDDPRHPDLGFYERVNADPTSIISTVNRATVLEKIDSDSRRTTRCLLDAATAGELAEFRLQEAATAASTALLPTFDDPRRDAHEHYTLAIDGVESSTLWRVRSWSRRLSVSGVMRHELGQAKAVTVTTP